MESKERMIYSTSALFWLNFLYNLSKIKSFLFKRESKVKSWLVGYIYALVYASNNL